MAEDKRISSEQGTDNKVDITQKRKRVKRIKTAIVITIIFLFTLPTILCIILGIRLSKLQRQVDNLFSIYSTKSEEKGQRLISGKYAYASTGNKSDGIISNDDTEEDDTLIIPTVDDFYIEDSDDTHEELEISDIDDIYQESEYENSNSENDESENEEPENDESRNEDTYNEDLDNDETENVDSNAVDTRYDTEAPLTGGTNRGNAGQDSTYNTSEYYRDPDGIYYDKKVYLTFDDGPTKHTDEILDILTDYNIKATFFVVGHEDEVSKERYRRIVDEGHVLAIHSYSHKYKDIYKSIENFDKDFTKLWNLLYDTTGYTPTLYRFPGGSFGYLSKSKMKEYVRYLDKKGMTYYDWNVVNGDAEGKSYTEEQMIDNVLNGVARKKTSIVLMHDGEGKDKTVTTLPDILDALISGGAELLPLDENAPLIQQIKASSLK